MASKPHIPPAASKGDVAHSIARAGIGSVPVIGNAAVELFQLLVTPPLEKRRQAWMESIADGLNQLEEKQRCTIEDLKSNDAFIDTIMQASQAAVRTSQQEKLEALRNAVLNSALPRAPDESRQQVFINWVDSMTVGHLRILHLLNDPKGWFQIDGSRPPQQTDGKLQALIASAFPDLCNELAISELIAGDLHRYGLIRITSFNSQVVQYALPQAQPMSYGSMPGIGVTTYSGDVELLQQWTTTLGQQFLRFITTP